MKRIQKVILASALLFVLLVGSSISVGAMQIFIEVPESSFVTLEVEPTDRIEDLKLKIEDKLGIAWDRQVIIFAGHELEEGNTLQDYSIQKDSTLQLVVLHVHEASAAWTSDANEHWHVCTGEDCEERLDIAVHVFDNACDTACNTCNAAREVAHAYDHACDTACNLCGVERTVSHAYDHACDTDCNLCGVERTVSHAYDHACDTDCNLCGVERTVSHAYDHACDTDCNICSATRATDPHVDANGNGACDICSADMASQRTIHTGAVAAALGGIAGAVLLIGIVFKIKRRGK